MQKCSIYSIGSHPRVQAQYVFIHNSLSELVICGEIEVAAVNFRIKMTQLQNPVAGDPYGRTGFQKQFEVFHLYSTSLHYNNTMFLWLTDMVSKVTFL